MNYYDILEVKKDATQQEIRDSYKNLMKKYHPDIYAGDKKYAEKITAEINAAYDVLCDEEKRAEYDLSLETPEPEITYNYEPPNVHYRASQYYQTYTTQQTEEKRKTWDEHFRENIYNYVDKHSSNVSPRGKYIFVIIIILIALLLTLVSLNDYMTFLSMPQWEDRQQETPYDEEFDEFYDDEFYQDDYTRTSPSIPREQSY